MYFANLHSSEGSSHVHYNLFYDPVKHDGPLLPPAAALAPTIWPQFHLRWACPEEVRAGEVESQWRVLTKKYADMTKVPLLNIEIWPVYMQFVLKDLLTT